jgi:hypothetical protein
LRPLPQEPDTNAPRRARAPRAPRSARGLGPSALSTQEPLRGIGAPAPRSAGRPRARRSPVTCIVDALDQAVASRLIRRPSLTLSVYAHAIRGLRGELARAIGAALK